MLKITLLIFITCFFQLMKSQNHSEPSKIGKTIKGDFNGDGKLEIAQLVKVKQGYGNPIEDGIADEYEIQFSDKNIASIKIGCCEAILVNEGDLNNDDKDELSIFQAPMNGCVYMMRAYTFSESSWEIIVDPFLIPTGCDSVTEKEIQDRIIKENNTIYYFITDPNEGNLIKQKIKL